MSWSYRPRPATIGMNKRNVILVLVIIIALSVITYFFVSRNSSPLTTLPTTINSSPQQPVTTTGNNPATPVTPQSLNGKKLLTVSFLLKSDHKLYMEYDASIVPMDKLFDLENSTGNLKQIKGVDELSRVTEQISTKEQALAFVKFFTTEPTRHLLKPSPISGIEPSDLYVQMPSSLSRLLTSTKVEKIDGRWIIERDLLMYPNWENQKQQTPAQMLRSRETISQAGSYTFSISKVLAEGDEIDNLLPYYE